MEVLQIKNTFRAKFLPLLSPFRFKLLFGGRDGGKSHIIAEALLMYALRQHERFLCLREIQNSIKESVKALFEDKIKEWKLDYYFKITKDEIVYLPFESLFIFKGLHNTTAENLKSYEGITKCWIEEGQTITRNSLTTLIPTIRKPGSEIWISWNPKKETDPVGEMFLGYGHKDKNNPFVPPPNSFIQKVTWRDNRFLSKESIELKDWHKKRDYDEYLHIWEGFPEIKSEFRVFKNWKVEYFDAPHQAPFLYGADWGFSKDPAAVVRLWLDLETRDLYIDQEAYEIGVEISDTPAFFERLSGIKAWTVTADSSRPEIISYLNNKGFNIVAAKKGKDSVERGIKWLQDFNIHIHSRCTNVIDEFTHYKFKEHPETGKPTPYLEDKNNHAIDAIRYAVEDVMRNGHRSYKPFVVNF